MPPLGKARSEREQLELFHAIAGDFAPRDAQDLMAFPFFSLAKSPRMVPIDYRTPDVTIRVEASAEHGMATIWDADVLIWAASHLVAARDVGRRTSRLMVASPREILTFIGRGDSARDYERLEAAFDRLQSTTIKTSLRQTGKGQLHRFSWINEWKRHTAREGRTRVIELILPDWFYQAVLDDALVLTIDPAYFGLTGGLERWLYRIVRKHGGRQRAGWAFGLRHLYEKSASLSPYRRFAFELREMAKRQPFAGYRLSVRPDRNGNDTLAFAPVKLSTGACGQAVNSSVLSVVDLSVPSLPRHPCYRLRKTPNHDVESKGYGALNLESNLKESNYKDVGPPFRSVDKPRRGVMIVAFLNQKGGVGKTTLALHLAGQWARKGRRVTVIDADPQGSALDWSAQRAREGLPRLFGVIGLARDTLHHEAPQLAQGVDHVVIDGPPRVAALLRSALLAADLVLIPAQPSPFDGWASAEMLRLLEDARLFRPGLLARFVLNRCAARTVIARETRLALVGHEPAALMARIGQRVAFADAARTGRLVCDLRPHGIAAREIAAMTAEIGGLA